MRILVVTQYFTPDITAAAFRLADTVQCLAEAGDEVRVITAEPHKGHADDAPAAALPAELGVRIWRCRVKPVVGTGAKAYLKHYLSFLWRSCFRGVGMWLCGYRPDVVFASSPPLFVGLTGRFLSLLFWRPLVFEIRDIWPDSAVAAGQLSSDGRAYRIGRRVERYLYRKARRITCVSRPQKEYLQGETKTPVEVIYNGVMRRWHENQSRPPAAAPTGDAAKTILYAGNLGRVQGLDLLIRGFAELLAAGELTDWRVRLIGDGALRADLQNDIETLGVSDRVCIDAPMSREQVQKEMAAAGLLYLSLVPDATLAKTIPSKVFDYLLMERPIVAGLVGEGRDILESTGANICFEPGSLDQLKSALRRAAGEYDALSGAAPKNRELVLTSFTREGGAKKLRAIFEELVSSRRRRR